MDHVSHIKETIELQVKAWERNQRHLVEAVDQVEQSGGDVTVLRKGIDAYTKVFAGMRALAAQL